MSSVRWMSLITAAARCPARREPANIQLFLLCADAHNKKAWLFVGGELASQRAAIIMSLLQSAKVYGHDPWVYLRDVLTRLPGYTNSRFDKFLPHRWQLQS